MKGGNKLPTSMKQGMLLLNPEPLKEIPQPPEGLDEITEKVWYDTADMLVREKILTEFDLNLLKHYCVISGLCIKFELYLCSPEATIFSTREKQLLRQNPYLKQYQDLSKQLLSVAEHFGMTPKARGKVGIKGPKAEVQTDKLKDFIDGGTTYEEDEAGL